MVKSPDLQGQTTQTLSMQLTVPSPIAYPWVYDANRTPPVYTRSVIFVFLTLQVPEYKHPTDPSLVPNFLLTEPATLEMGESRTLYAFRYSYRLPQ